MKIICDSCGTKYSISDDKVRGKVFKIRCKKCSHIIVVRGGETQDESAAAPAPASADGGWHIVVEGEQVGPISESDVRARLERGEIRADTYIWKEGFADWLKLSTVPEFADAAPADSGSVSGSVSVGDVFASDGAVVQQPVSTNGSGGRRRSGANKPLFGDGGGDIFAAPAAAAPSSGGDLFGSAGAHAAASSEPRWPSSSGAAMAGHDGGRVENLTGQRHENSVLFSLANLQSLAMPSAKPAPAASFGSAAPAPTTEGSGLIDIRAMAASTRPAAVDGPGSASDDDLPAFGSFSPAAPVLLPLPSQSGPSKLIYVAITGMLLLVVVIGWLAYRVIAPKQVVVEKVVQVQVPAPAAPAAAAKGEEQGKKPSTIAEKDLPPREGGPAAAKEGAQGKDEKSGKEKGGHHSSKSGGGKDAKKGVAAEEKKAGPVAAIAEPPRPAKGSLDDLLNGATKSGGKGPKVSDDDGPKKGGGGGESAGPLSRNALVAGFNSVRPKVANCYNQFKVPGTAMVNVQIAKSGKVTSATVTGKFAGTPTGTCVEAAVKTASFPPSDGFSTPYPFQLK
jgi:predicted Zn finger-like uncharacterized protein